MLATLARRSIASLPRPLRWRTRNAIALARWVLIPAGAGAQPYDGDFWRLHDSGDWDGLAAVIVRFCAPASLADVGCGDGKLLAALRRRRPALPLLGIDSAQAALDHAAAGGVPVAKHDLASGGRAPLRALRERLATFDVVVSLEAAEHLPPWAGPRFIETLAGGARAVVFSAAQPDQGGTLHMNERQPEYWRRQFASRGYGRSPVDAAFREAVARLDLPPWYGANVHVFERRG
jgi:SAM-dependent methyltransferase